MCSGKNVCIGEMVNVVKSEMEPPSPYVGRGSYVLYTGYKRMCANAMAARNASCCCALAVLPNRMSGGMQCRPRTHWLLW